MKKFLLTSAVLLSAGAPAFADDLSTSTAPGAYSWTGFYAGVHAGPTWQDRSAERGLVTGSVAPDFDYDANLNEGGPSGGVAEGSPLAAIFPSEFGSSEKVGMSGGVQAGYNQQYGRFALGFEADFTGLGSNGGDDGAVQGLTASNPAFGDAVFGTDLRVRSSMDYLATTRLRAGVVTDRFLVYGTGGAAVGNPEHQVDFSAGLTATGGTLVGPLDRSNSFSGRKDDWKGGWTAGAGGEFAFTDNMTLKAEYLYYDLGETHVGATSTSAPGFAAVYGFENRGQSARIALNRKF